MKETTFEARGRTLALVAYNRILDNPDSWKQEEWRCGTACCFAGHVALAAGYQWAEDDPHAVGGSYVIGPLGRPDHVMVAARKLLGLPHEVALYEMFYADLTLAEIRAAIDEHLPEETT